MSLSIFEFDRSSPLPLYHQLAERIKAEIQAGHYSAGDQLPTEVEFVNATNLSQITVRQALDQLVRQGLIARERGRGTFVRKPNSNAGPQRPESTHRRIAAVLPWSSTSIFALVLTGIEEVTSQRGYQLLMVNTADDSRVEMQKLREVVGHGMDGVIWGPPTRGSNPTMVFRLSHEGLPVVAVDRLIYGIEMPVDAVVSDNRQALQLAVEHLVAGGCRQLAYLEDTSVKASSRFERRDAMIKACRRMKLHEPVMFRSRKSYIDNGRAAAQQLFSRIGPIDGVIAQSGSAAVGFVEQIRSMNVRVPEDVQVVGFDGNCPIEAHPMSFTSIIQDFHAMGARAAGRLIDRIEGKINTEPTIERIGVTLDPKSTTRHAGQTVGRPRRRRISETMATMSR